MTNLEGNQLSSLQVKLLNLLKWEQNQIMKCRRPMTLHRKLRLNKRRRKIREKLRRLKQRKKELTSKKIKNN